jgi:hypothetical protein
VGKKWLSGLLWPGKEGRRRSKGRGVGLFFFEEKGLCFVGFSLFAGKMACRG